MFDEIAYKLIWSPQPLSCHTVMRDPWYISRIVKQSARFPHVGNNMAINTSVCRGILRNIRRDVRRVAAIVWRGIKDRCVGHQAKWKGRVSTLCNSVYGWQNNSQSVLHALTRVGWQQEAMASYVYHIYTSDYFLKSALLTKSMEKVPSENITVTCSRKWTCGLEPRMLEIRIGQVRLGQWRKKYQIKEEEVGRAYSMNAG
jgi:hypothetical protein